MMLPTCEKDIFFYAEDGKMYVAIRNDIGSIVKYIRLTKFIEELK